MLNQNPTNAATTTSTSTDERQYLISDENYQLLKHFQQDIFKEIELLPSIRKLVNELITADNLAKIKPKYLELFIR